MKVTDVKPGDRINFSLYNNTALTTEYSGCTVLGVLDYDTAKIFIDPTGLHQNIYPALPDGALDDPEAYSYFKLRLVSGEDAIIGLPWIREETLAVDGRGTLTVIIEDALPTDVEQVTRAIAAIGLAVTSTKMS